MRITPTAPLCETPSDSQEQQQEPEAQGQEQKQETLVAQDDQDEVRIGREWAAEELTRLEEENETLQQTVLICTRWWGLMLQMELCQEQLADTNLRKLQSAVKQLLQEV